MDGGSTLSPKWGIGLQDLSEGDRQVILSRMRTASLPAKAPLFVQGSPSSRLFIVEQGRVSVSQVASNGDEHVIGICSGGSTVGLSTVVLDAPHNVSAATVGTATVSSIHRDELVDCMRIVPQFGLNVAKLLAMTVVESFNQRAYMAGNPASVRLATAIASLAQRSSDDLAKPAVVSGVSQEELAKIVGVGRPWVSQKLREFEEIGLISRQKLRIVIRDFDELSAYIKAEKGVNAPGRRV